MFGNTGFIEADYVIRVLWVSYYDLSAQRISKLKWYLLKIR